MRRTIKLAGLILILGALVPGSGVSAVRGSDVPLKGTADGEFTADLSTGAVHVVGTGGELSHLGRWTSSQDIQLVPLGAGRFAVFASNGTMTAANGDRLFFTGQGGGSGNPGVSATFTINYSATGGTGRFADAGATFVSVVHTERVSLVGSLETGVFAASFDGSLSYR